MHAPAQKPMPGTVGAYDAMTPEEKKIYNRAWWAQLEACGGNINALDNLDPVHARKPELQADYDEEADAHGVTVDELFK